MNNFPSTHGYTHSPILWTIQWVGTEGLCWVLANLLVGVHGGSGFGAGGVKAQWAI